MTYVVYADILLLWHIVINFIVLYITNKMLYLSNNTIKTIIWSIITAIILLVLYFATLELNTVVQIITYICIYTFILFLYSYGSFKYSIIPKLIHILCGNILATCVIAGIISIFVFPLKTFYLIPLCIIICTLLPHIFKSIKKKNEACNNLFKITLKTSNKILSATGFWDTGNTLFDFYNKCPVIIIDYRLMSRLLKSTDYKVVEKYHLTGIFDYQQLPQVDTAYIYPLPYRTISSNFATMPAFKLKEVHFYNENQSYKNIVAAISKNKLKNKYDYQVLLNESIKPNREEYSND